MTPVRVVVDDVPAERARLEELLGAGFALDQFSDEAVGLAAAVLALAGQPSWSDVETDDPPPLGDRVWLAVWAGTDTAVVLARRVRQGCHDEWRADDDTLYERPLAWAPVHCPSAPRRTVSWA